MHRRGDGALIRNAIAKAREIIPGVSLRTSLIVGFPGETRRRFENLLSFVREIRFDHLGIFSYSREGGTEAAALPSRISEREKERRRNLVMEEQALISREINSALIGTRQEVLVEGKGELSGYSHIGRCRRQAPRSTGRPISGEGIRRRERSSPAGSSPPTIMICSPKSSELLLFQGERNRFYNFSRAIPCSAGGACMRRRNQKIP